MKRVRETVEYKGFKIRLLRWDSGNYSYRLFSTDGRELARQFPAIAPSFLSRHSALTMAKFQVNVLLTHTFAEAA